MENLVSDIPAGDWKMANLFLQCRDLDSPLLKAPLTFPHYHEGLFINSSTENRGGAQDRSSMYIFPILKGLGREI
jgi:hypothetical protein